jgi:predicted DNA-binding transcriptional regulator YafY
MKSARLISIVLLLQTTGRMTAAALAARLDVSVRTVYRDVDALSMAGVPIEASGGRGGGLSLVRGYTTDLTGLRPDEAETLFLIGLGGAADALGLGPLLSDATLKIMAALAPTIRGRADVVRTRFHFAQSSWFAAPDEVPHLPSIARAVWRSRRIRITYDRGGIKRPMTVEPLGLALKAGRWYAVARRNEEIRTFRCSRIVDAVLLDEEFDYPSDWDLKQYWLGSEIALEASQRRQIVEVLAEPASREKLEFLFGRACVSEAFASADGLDQVGRLRLQLHVGSLEWAHDDLLRLGGAVEVLSPKSLRRQVANTADRMVALYRA